MSMNALLEISPVKWFPLRCNFSKINPLNVPLFMLVIFAAFDTVAKMVT